MIKRRNLLKGIGATLAALPFLSPKAQAKTAIRGSSPYIGEITTFAGNFAPLGWALCDGQLLLISEYDALFAILGTTYGGNGVTTFGLPDLRGRAPVCTGTGGGLSPYVLGEMTGAERVTLNATHIQSHEHDTPNVKLRATGALKTGLIEGGSLGTTGSITYSNSGGAQPHENMQPFLAMNFIIALYGIFPSPS